MSDTFVRTEMLQPETPPVLERGIVKWLRENLFSGPFNTILTLVGLYILWWGLSGFLPWVFGGVWSAESLGECRRIIAERTGGDGSEAACWAMIRERWPQYLFGFYPQSLYWRPTLAFVLLFVALAPVLFSHLPRKMIWFTLAYPLVAYILLWGGPLWTPLLVLISIPLGWGVWRLYAFRLNAVARIIYGLIVAAAVAYVLHIIGKFSFGVVSDFIDMMNARPESTADTAASSAIGAIFSWLWWLFSSFIWDLIFVILWLLFGLTWSFIYIGAALAFAGVVNSAWNRSSYVGLLAGVLVALAMLFYGAPIAGQWINSILPVGLVPVESDQFGGFLLAIVIGVTAISFSLPLGILLALGRQSDMFIVKTISVGFIEFIRGVPLITLLFTASLLLQYFLPPGTTFDLILRVIILVTFFAAAYLAEVIRGGLAALPRGQYEAADALGLDYWRAQRLIIMPQALKISIPGIVSTFIGLFKDTTLVSFVGLLDPLRGVTAAVRADIDWKGIYWEPYVFVGAIFFVICFGMSRYSMYLEQKLKTDHR